MSPSSNYILGQDGFGQTLTIILQHVTAFIATEYGATARGTEIVLHPPALAPVYQENPGVVEILPPIRIFLD
jgi:hypothetical protein